MNTNYYLFLARSVTHAQDMANVLGKAGIGTKIRRAGAGLAERGCGYSLEISESKFKDAAQALRKSGRMPVKMFYLSEKERFEVVL